MHGNPLCGRPSSSRSSPHVFTFARCLSGCATEHACHRLYFISASPDCNLWTLLLTDSHPLTHSFTAHALAQVSSEEGILSFSESALSLHNKASRNPHLTLLSHRIPPTLDHVLWSLVAYLLTISLTCGDAKSVHDAVMHCVHNLTCALRALQCGMIG